MIILQNVSGNVSIEIAQLKRANT